VRSTVVTVGASVGVVGLELGADEGLPEGDAVGRTVVGERELGFCVGVVEGSLVGRRVGYFVGKGVGLIEGAPLVGASVGRAVVGVPVGSIVGFELGEPVGFELGSSVGFELGEAELGDDDVGSCVGANVGLLLVGEVVGASEDGANV